MSRELTAEEVQEKFLKHIWALIEYWESNKDRPDARGKLEGLAFSILTVIDGESIAMPGFFLAPDPHPEDKPYNESRGENWFPENDIELVGDISGNLHEEFHKFDPRQT